MGGVRVGVLPVNSALFCQGDDDHAKLWVGRRSLDDAVRGLRGLDAELRIALIHHPLDWLADPERSNIRAKLAENVDVVLRGHLHEADVEQVVSPQGGVVYLAAGASYQTRRWPNRALYVTVQDSSLSVFPIRYEDSPTEVWTVDPSVFSAATDYTGLVQLAGATPTDVRSPGSSRGVPVIGQEPASAEPADEGVALERDHEDLLLALYKYEGKCGTIAAPVGEYECLWVPSFLIPMQWGWERTPAEAEISGKPRGNRTERLRWLFVVEDLVERGFLEETSAPQVEETRARRVFELTKDGQRFAYPWTAHAINDRQTMDCRTRRELEAAGENCAHPHRSRRRYLAPSPLSPASLGTRRASIHVLPRLVPAARLNRQPAARPRWPPADRTAVRDAGCT